MKILVTGALGYIGSHTCVELLNSGYDVLAVDNLSNSEISTLNRIMEITGKEVEFCQLDCRSIEFIDFLIDNSISLEGIIHFAAYKSTNESVSFPNRYYDNNLLSLINLMNLHERRRFGSLIFSSSCIVYGENAVSPVSENLQMSKDLTPYGNTKRIGEEILKDYSELSELNSVSLRYFNPIGAHESSLIGELPKGVPSNLLPYLCQVASGKREKLNVFGGDYNTKDGTAIRDFIHVRDLAKAHVRALEFSFTDKNRGSHVFNIGTGRGYSVLEVINEFERVNGVKIPYEIVERREGDIQEIFADTTKANSQLEWRAEFGLDDMLESAWKFELKISD